jgi:GPH family glycoside/pentoside/hexuronide:cation symporter
VAAAAGAAVMAVSMVLLFAVPPPVAPLLWFALAVTGLFSAYSFLGILFYAQGIAKAADLPGGHVRLAAWRESGALLGVCLAAVAPTLLAAAGPEPFALYAMIFAGAALAVALAMRGEWEAPVTARAPAPAVPALGILADRGARRLLILALVNATPLAVSSTLFLFFVESRLAAPGWEGALLLLFFLAAAASAPGWSLAASRHGARPVLLVAMVLAILAFAGAYLLGPGDVLAFAVICVVSGATIGADLVLLPALFARRLAVIAPDGGQGFGLWTFATKLSLAIAAVTLLPALESAGFRPGADNPPEALALLSALYALGPILLKLAAIALLLAIPLEDDRP